MPPPEPVICDGSNIDFNDRYRIPMPNIYVKNSSKNDNNKRTINKIIFLATLSIKLFDMISNYLS